MDMTLQQIDPIIDRHRGEPRNPPPIPPEGPPAAHRPPHGAPAI